MVMVGLHPELDAIALPPIIPCCIFESLQNCFKPMPLGLTTDWLDSIGGLNVGFFLGESYVTRYFLVGLECEVQFHVGLSGPPFHGTPTALAGGVRVSGRCQIEFSSFGVPTPK